MRVLLLVAMIIIGSLATVATAYRSDCRWTSPSYFRAASMTELYLCAAAGKRVNVGDNFATPLHYAAEGAANPWVIAALVHIGADLDAGDRYLDDTPLHYAARYNPNPDIIRILIASGADANARNKIGKTPMHAAAENGRSPPVIYALAAFGADPAARDIADRTPLDLAIDGQRDLAMIAAIEKAAAVKSAPPPPG